MAENDANDRLEGEEGGQDENTFTYGVDKDGRFKVDGLDMGREPGGAAPTRFKGENRMELEVRPGEKKEFTEAELIQALQDSESAKGRLEFAEPLVALAEKDPEALRSFLEWRNERIEAGIEEPPRPSVGEADVLGYRQRSQDPEFENIRDYMREWSLTQPEWVQE